jgi:hypothetical protein
MRSSKAEPHGSSARLSEPKWQIGRGQHASGRALVEKGIARIAAGKADEGQRRRPAGPVRQRRIDAGIVKRLAERLAEKIVGEAAEKPRGRPQPREGDGDVEGGAAGKRRERRRSVGCCPRQEIDQRFAARDDHR